MIRPRLLYLLLSAALVLPVASHAQIRPRVDLIGGDDVPAIKKRITAVLEAVLAEVNLIDKGKGARALLKSHFADEAFGIFGEFVRQNGACAAAKSYRPQMIARLGGRYFDVRSIAMKINPGGNEAGSVQNLVFTFSSDGLIISARAVLPNYDYQSVIAAAISPADSQARGRILDFLERFRIAYQMKDREFLEKVFSDDALIIAGTVLRKKEGPSGDFMRTSHLGADKVRLVQLSKQEYLDRLKRGPFRTSSFINIVFENVEILQHEKFPEVYGVSCSQQWKSSRYADSGHLFLMMDFRSPEEPVIHVRAWQPAAFDDGTYISMYDFDLVQF